MQLLKEILGDMMFIPSPEHRPPIAFLSPEELKNRIIISDKPPGESVACQVQNLSICTPTLFCNEVNFVRCKMIVAADSRAY